MKPKTVTGPHARRQSAGARVILRDCRRMLIAKKRRDEQRTEGRQ